MQIKCVVAGYSYNGPDFYICVVECSSALYSSGEHYEEAMDQAREYGFDKTMVAFDENDGPSALFDLFNWSEAPVFKINIPEV